MYNIKKDQIFLLTDVKEDDLLLVVKDVSKSILKPALILLEGELGSGKTYFVKKFASFILNIHNITSPTYSIINSHDKLIHADFYRIEKASQITPLELPLYLEGNDYFFIEWGTKYMESYLKYFLDTFNFYQLTIKQNISINFRDYGLYKLKNYNK